MTQEKKRIKRKTRDRFITHQVPETESTNSPLMKSLVYLISGILKPCLKLPFPFSAMGKCLENRREEREF
jgi:hypothetical protein